MMKTDEIIKDFKEIRQEYAWNSDIMSNEDTRVAAIKEIINKKLSQVDKTIILLYVDCQSYRKLGKRLGLSHMTIRKECLRIKKIILDEYEKGAVSDAAPGLEHQLKSGNGIYSLKAQEVEDNPLTHN